VIGLDAAVKFAGVLLQDSTVRLRVELAMGHASEQTSDEDTWWRLFFERCAQLEGHTDGTLDVALALYRSRTPQKQRS